MQGLTKGIGRFFAALGMTVAGIWIILPFYWAIITSLKRPADVFRLSFVPFLQFEPTLANWRNELVLRRNELVSGLSTSFLVAFTAAMLALAIGTLAGYALARFRYQRWKNKISPFGSFPSDFSRRQLPWSRFSSCFSALGSWIPGWP